MANANLNANLGFALGRIGSAMAFGYQHEITAQIEFRYLLKHTIGKKFKFWKTMGKYHALHKNLWVLKA